MANKTANSMINMRVTANSIQGHRKYMEDCYKIRFQRESSLYANRNKAMLNAAKLAGFKLNAQNHIDENSQSDILFSYFAIFDGHGGKEASQFAKERLYWKIVEQSDFWSGDDDKVLDSIKRGFYECHLEMWDELSNWPKTPSGLPSTSGSTATVLFIRKNKAYVGHVGDSGLVIGYTKNSHSATSHFTSNIPWLAKKLTKDHKPEDPTELRRIESSGGSVMPKGGINRVVWNRPIVNNNTNNLKRNTMLNSTSMSQLTSYKSIETPVQTERIPFLAVARSLGDLWSYDCNRDEFIVSPIPDVFHFDLDPRFHKCLILATDGLWNVMRASECVELVRQTDRETDELKRQEISSQQQTSAQPFVNPSQRLNSVALQKCCEKMIRADNTTCITIMLDQPLEDSDTEDDDYLNSDETLIQAANITSLLPINKTLDKTKRVDDSEYYHENVFKNDDDDDVNDDENEIENHQNDDKIVDDDINNYEIQRRKRSKSKKIFNQTTSTTIESDFNTPLNRRSRSLMSLRRRHWSASSNRSASNNNITNLNSVNNNNNNNNKNKFVNSEYREQRRLFPTDNDNASKATRMNHQINKSNSSQCITSLSASNVKSSSRLKNSSNYQSAPNFNQTSKIKISRTITRTTTTTFQIKQESRKSMNVSSISFKGINRLSKNLRKSFNDIYSLNNSGETRRKSRNNEIEIEENLDDSKENQNSSKYDKAQKTSPNKYSKRLKRFKNTILKSSIFSKKKTKTNCKHKSEDLNVSKSMPDLNRIELCDKDDDTKCNNYSQNETNLKTNQSFVNNVKAKFNNLKRNKYFNNETNLEAKRPKFY